jgi:hypothetical protein
MIEEGAGYKFEDVTQFQGIEIITDACHGCSKNAKATSINVVGVKSGKLLHHEHVTKA